VDQVLTVTRLAVVSDVHMREGERESIESELRATVERFEAFDPHHAFVLGDLIEDGATATIDRAHVEAVHGMFDDAPFPTTFLLGNHDVENLSRAALAEALDGQRRFVHVEVDGRDVLYLDSSVPRLPGARGEVGEVRLAVLRERLPTVEDALLFVHHPIGYYDIRENPWFGEFPERAFLGDRLELLELVAGTSAIRATFGGHIHETRATTFRGLDHAVVNAFSKERPDVPVTGTRAEVVVGSDIEIDVYERDRRVESFVLG
jgi:3',5'-cyclic AMP phosphodiesterase CpdA